MLPRRILRECSFLENSSARKCMRREQERKREREEEQSNLKYLEELEERRVRVSPIRRPTLQSND